LEGLEGAGIVQVAERGDLEPADLVAVVGLVAGVVVEWDLDPGKSPNGSASSSTNRSLTADRAGYSGRDRGSQDPFGGDQPLGQPLPAAAWREGAFLPERDDRHQQIECVEGGVEFGDEPIMLACAPPADRLVTTPCTW
jgi:hypothetical protein